MVVAGVPEKNVHHAESMASFSLAMLHAASEVPSPRDKQPIKVLTLHIFILTMPFCTFFPTFMLSYESETCFALMASLILNVYTTFSTGHIG